jgi:hypothetical protein
VLNVFGVDVESITQGFDHRLDYLRQQRLAIRECD